MNHDEQRPIRCSYPSSSLDLPSFRRSGFLLRRWRNALHGQYGEEAGTFGKYLAPQCRYYAPGRQATFVRDDELKEAWAIFTPLLYPIEREKVKPILYDFGDRGPPESDQMLKDRRYYEYHG